MNMWFNLTYLLSHVHFNTSSKHSSSSPPLPLPLPTIIDATNLTHVNVLNIPIANMKEPIVNPDMWVCGSGKLSESGSFYTVLNWCREKMPELNECCSVHDSCYRLKVGTREVCDDKFCDCIDNALSKPQGMDQFCISNSKIAPHNYCPLVKIYGEDAYNYDTNKWFPQYHPVLNQTANAAYMRLYGQCRGIKEPLSVCAYNHMACTLKMRPRDRYSEEYTDCRQYLLNCITTATDFLMKSNPSCLNHVKKVIKMIKDDARKSGLPKALHWKYTLSSSSSQLQYFAISALSLMIFNF